MASCVTNKAKHKRKPTRLALNSFYRQGGIRSSSWLILGGSHSLRPTAFFLFRLPLPVARLCLLPVTATEAQTHGQSATPRSFSWLPACGANGVLVESLPFFTWPFAGSGSGSRSAVLFLFHVISFSNSIVPATWLHRRRRTD